MRRFTLPAFAAAFFSLAAPVAAELPPEIDTSKPPPVREISDGIYDVEGVRVDQLTSTVTVNGKIEMAEGVLEYALVNDQGKLHESLLSTTVQPYYLHVAMLLMGVKDIVNAPAEPPPGQITAEYLAQAPKLDGDPLKITVSWVQADGAAVEKPIEELILEMEKPAAKGTWFYNGSMVYRGRFLAQEDRSIIALITDPSALVNNRSADRDKDGAWAVNPKTVPPLNTPVQIRFHLPNTPAE
jgi:hypothetical protein